MTAEKLRVHRWKMCSMQARTKMRLKATSATNNVIRKPRLEEKSWGKIKEVLKFYCLQYWPKHPTTEKPMVSCKASVVHRRSPVPNIWPKNLKATSGGWINLAEDIWRKVANHPGLFLNMKFEYSYIQCGQRSRAGQKTCFSSACQF